LDRENDKNLTALESWTDMIFALDIRRRTFDKQGVNITPNLAILTQAASGMGRDVAPLRNVAPIRLFAVAGVWAFRCVSCILKIFISEFSC